VPLSTVGLDAYFRAFIGRQTSRTGDVFSGPGEVGRLRGRITPKNNAFLWSPAEFDPDMASETSRGLANIKAIWGIWLDCDGCDLCPVEFAAMFPHLTMVMYNSASSTMDAPRWRAVIPTTCAMTIDAHRDILMQLMKALNRRGYYSKKQLEKRAQRGLGGKLHGFDPSKFAACSLFYLPVQAAAGRDASFFMVFDGGKRQAVNPYEWIDKTIIDHRPEPEPDQIAAADLADPGSDEQNKGTNDWDHFGVQWIRRVRQQHLVVGVRHKCSVQQQIVDDLDPAGQKEGHTGQRRNADHSGRQHRRDRCTHGSGHGRHAGCGGRRDAATQPRIARRRSERAREP
jgi:hypothetical protein